MADQWYYAQQGQRQGPVAEEQLKQLASSGQLKPTDKVWKQGMAAWQAVSQIPGLFPFVASDEPPPIPSDPSPPPLPQETTPLPKTSMATKARQLMASLGGKGKAAAQLVAKQAERTKLSNVTLPSAFRAFGAHVYGDGTFRADFADIYQRLDGHVAQIKTLQTPSVKAEGFAQKAKAVAKAANDTVHAQALKLKVNHAYADLGKAVFEKHGEKSVPAELLQPILNARAGLDTLDAAIRQLSQSQPGQVLSPKRIVVGGVALAVLVLGLIATKAIFLGSDHGAATATTERAPTSTSGDEESGSEESPSVRIEQLRRAGVTFKALDAFNLRVGQAGYLECKDGAWHQPINYLEVRSVLGEKKLLVVAFKRILTFNGDESRTSEPMVLYVPSTRGMVDGQKLKPPKLIEVIGTEQYTSTSGATKTVFASRFLQ